MSGIDDNMKKRINEIVSNLSDQPNMVRISLRLKPDHIIEVMKLLETLQDNG